MEDLPVAIRIVFLFALLGANAFFATAEVALVSVRKTRLKQLVEEGSRPARLALDLAESPGRMLSATQLGVTLASLGLGWAGESALYGPLSNLLGRLPAAPAEGAVHVAAFGIAFLCITFFHMVLGEVVPKNFAIERSERLALAVAPPLQLFARASGFFVSMVKGSAWAILKAIGLRPGESGTTYSADELKQVFAAASLPGRPAARSDGGNAPSLLERAVDFYQLSVRAIMVPRKDLVSLPSDAKPDQIVDCLARHRHSRVPVYEGSPENLIGLLHAKEFWAYIQQVRQFETMGLPSPAFRMKRYLHDLEFVPETKALHELLEDFQRKRYQMAAVVDEFGTVVGVVTAEDAIEQIVGELREEHERVETSGAASKLELDGITNIVDLETQHAIKLPYDAGFETLAGFLLSRLGHLPAEGESVTYEGRVFTVAEMEGNRIDRVLVEQLEAEEPSAETAIKNGR